MFIEVLDAKRDGFEKVHPAGDVGTTMTTGFDQLLADFAKAHEGIDQSAKAFC
jgi:hypothetical protein